MCQLACELEDGEAAGDTASGDGRGCVGGGGRRQEACEDTASENEGDEDDMVALPDIAFGKTGPCGDSDALPAPPTLTRTASSSLPATPSAFNCRPVPPPSRQLSRLRSCSARSIPPSGCDCTCVCGIMRLLRWQGGGLTCLARMWPRDRECLAGRW